MGQTLTHGIYLPDEGERNCYDGLASNWSILDGAVGTVAEHTSQIAGKAPAVHTHTKSDVTDLLNSNFIPSANNSYNLGSSSYQWNNLYAKNYYYNGTQWGLDKDNTWTGANTFQGNFYHKSGSSALVKGTNPSSIIYYGSFRHQTYAGEEINLFRGYIGTTGDNCYRWSVEPWVSGSNGRFQMRVSSDGSVRAFEVDGTEVSPYTDNATNLGTSTKRWKTLNGINPGALSLPNIEASTNIAGDITDFTGATQLSLNSSFIGWVYIQIPNVQGDYIEVQVGNSASIRYFVSAGYSDSLDSIEVLVPKPQVVTKVRVKATGGAVSKALLYPCQGNV